MTEAKVPVNGGKRADRPSGRLPAQFQRTRITKQANAVSAGTMTRPITACLVWCAASSFHGTSDRAGDDETELYDEGRGLKAEQSKGSGDSRGRRSAGLCRG
jgi:hypothetical protein